MNGTISEASNAQVKWLTDGSARTGWRNTAMTSSAVRSPVAPART